MNIFAMLSVYDLRGRVGAYLNCGELGSVSTTCKALNSEEYFQLVWKELTIRRWLRSRKRVPDRLCLKHRGVYSWKYTYKMWYDEQKIPAGRITQNNDHVFGRGRQKGLDAWLFLVHSPDSRLLPTADNRVIGKMRVCLQSHGHDVVGVDLGHAFDVAMKSDDGDNNKEDNIHVIGCSLSEVNGVTIKNKLSGKVLLNRDDCAMFIVHVSCPSDMDHETDFLETMKSVHIECIDMSDNKHGEGHSMSLDVDIYDSEVIWNSYHTVPGGAVLLKES
jgi:hypothetical protein